MTAESFNAWEHATTEQEAVRKIAYRVAEMQRLFSEAVMIADCFGLRVDGVLKVPDDCKGGHNSTQYAEWRSSAKSC